MLRIKNSALNTSHGCSYFQGKPYTGLAFSIEGTSIPSIDKYEDGILVNHTCENIDDSVEMIDATGMLPQYELDEFSLVINNEKFSGVAYEFETDYCVRKLIYSCGAVLSEEAWNKSGNLKRHYSESGSIWEYFEWFDNGALKKVNINLSSNIFLELELTAAQDVKYIKMSKNYFDNAREYMQDVVDVKYLNIGLLDDFTMADTFFATGEGFDDLIFQRLLPKGSLSSIIDVELFKTAISEQGLDKLKDSTKLKKLIIVNGSDSVLDSVIRLKQLFPKCYVELNRTEIAA